jgi:hypothetical protein
MQSHYTYQDTNISLKIGFKNIRRRSPTRDLNWSIETQVEEINQDANLAAGFAVLTTTLNKLNLINIAVRRRIPRAKSDITPKQGKRHSTTTTPKAGNHRKNNFGKQSYQTGRCNGFTGAGRCVG